MRYRNAVPFVFVLCLVLIGLAGCWNNSNPVTPVANPQVAYNVEFPTGEGNGTNQVKLNKLATGLNTISMQIRISNVAPEFNTVASIKTADGKIREFKKASIPFDGLVLAANDIDFKGVQNFDSLTFSSPIPAGAKVEILNADKAQNAMFGIRAAAIAALKYRCDYNNDFKVNSHDIAVMSSYLILKGGNPTHETVASLATDLWGAWSGPIVALPTDQIDDLNGDGAVTSQDAAIMIAWYQVGNDRNKVLARAKELFLGVVGPIVRLPMEVLSSHNAPLGQIVSNWNNYQLQVKIKNVPADFYTSAYFNCINEVPEVKSILWSKSPAVIASDGLLLICTEMNPYTVLDFSEVRFTNNLPIGAVVEVINKDTGEIISSTVNNNFYGITINPSSISIQANNSLALNNITVTAHYIDGASKNVSSVTWEIHTGSGTIQGNNFLAPDLNGLSLLKCAYGEGNATNSAFLKVYYSKVPDAPNTPTGFLEHRQYIAVGEFSIIRGIAFDKFGALNIVGDLTSSGEYKDQIKRYNSNGDLDLVYAANMSTLTFGNPRDLIQLHGHAADLAFAGNSHFDYVTIDSASKMQAYDKVGTPGGISYVHSMMGVVQHGNYIYLCNGHVNRVVKIGLEGTYYWSAIVPGLRHYAQLRDVEFDSNGNMYIAAYDRILKYGPEAINGISTLTPELWTTFDQVNNTADHFVNANSIAIDSQDKIYVADKNRVLVFNTQGEILQKIGAPSDNPWNTPRWGSEERKHFEQLHRIEVGPNNKIYVSEYATNKPEKCRIVVLDY